MSQNLNNNGQPIKVLWFGDLVAQSGFGRIGNEVTKRLAARGWALVGGSVPWGGWPPPDLPYPVWGFGGQDIWNKVTALANQVQPDIIVVCQDYPYAQTLFHGCRIDWSVTKLIVVTPIDGTPVHPDWVTMSRDYADATMVISQFGVEGLRLAGVQADLLHPGVDANEFYPAESGDEVRAIREKVGIAPETFVIGSFMMNQGRKMVSATVAAFREFAVDKPDAVLYLDMEKVSPAGWDIPNLLKQVGVNPEQVKYRDDARDAGVTGLRERMIMCDISSQMAHREGFGLPNIESQACGVPPTVLDWCSGSEIAGGERGVLVRRIDYMEHGTWGGARDGFPDMRNWVGQWSELYRNRARIDVLATKGREWAVQHTWDKATDQFETVLKRVAAEQRKERAAYEPAEPAAVNVPAPGLSDEHGPGHPQHSGPGLQRLIEGV